MTRTELAQRLVDLRCKSRVYDRVMRLNPNGCPEGSIPRGMERGHDGYWHYGFWNGHLSKGRFIRRFGRAAWEAMPNGCKIKNGRRQFVSRVVVDDRLWTMYLPGWTRHPVEPEPGADGRTSTARPVYPTRRYSNDPRGCPVEYEQWSSPVEVVETILRRYGHVA